MWQVDMSSFDSIKKFTTRAAGLERVDILVANAAIATSQFQLAEGMESTVVVNVVGTFLMAIGFLPILRKSAKKTGLTPVVSIVSSEVHAWSHLNERNEDSIFEALKENKKEYMVERYPTSKLLVVLATRALAAQMSSGAHSSEPVILNTPNPGLCHSSLARNITGLRGWYFWLYKLIIARSTEVGSRTLLAAAVAKEDSHGQYMSGLCGCTAERVHEKRGGCEDAGEGLY